MKVIVEFEDLKKLADEAAMHKRERDDLCAKMSVERKALDLKERKQEAYNKYLAAKGIWLEKIMHKLGKKMSPFIGNDEYKAMSKAWAEFDAVQKEGRE